MKNIEDIHIHVVGDFMIDHWIYGNANRISQEAPVPIVSVSNEEYKLGGAGNVVANLASIGVKTSCTMLTGQDEGKRKLFKLMESLDVDVHAITLDNINTTIKTRIVSNQQHTQMFRYDVDCNRYVIFDEDLVEIPDNVDVIIVSDYNKGFMSHKMMIHLVKSGKPIIVDPKPQHVHMYRGCYFMTPNNHEWETIRNSEYMDSLEHLCSNILITRGKDGMDLVSIENGTHQHIPAKERKIFNVTGAGDTVIATFTTCLAMGFSKYESAMCANEFGGMVVEKPGTATISKHEFSDVVQMVVNNVRTT